MAEVQKKLDLSLITGEPGMGKTTTGVKILVDKCGLTTPPYKQRFTNDPDYTKNYHVFANIHLFGIKYAYLPLEKLILHMNTTVNGLPINHPDAIPLVGYGIYLYDEASQGNNARESNSNDTMVLQSLVLQGRHRHLAIIFVAQFSRLMTWDTKGLTKQWIECERKNLDSPIITLTVKRDGQPKHSFNFNGSKTWRYFKSDEIHALSDARLARAYDRAKTGGEN
jgi:hypothetical protein